MSDGKLWGTFPTSLGASNTPTKRGIKVIMEKGASICMTARATTSAASSSPSGSPTTASTCTRRRGTSSNIERGIDSSNGCTNLLPADAQKLYDLLEIGDVVKYPNANGPQMTLGDGYGDWNVSVGAVADRRAVRHPLTAQRTAAAGLRR